MKMHSVKQKIQQKDTILNSIWIKYPTSFIMNNNKYIYSLDEGYH